LTLEVAVNKEDLNPVFKRPLKFCLPHIDFKPGLCPKLKDSAFAEGRQLPNPLIV